MNFKLFAYWQGLSLSGTMVTPGTDYFVRWAKKIKLTKKLKKREAIQDMDNTAQNSQNVQDGFLNNLRKDRVNVTIYLMGGVKLTGKIRSFDKFSLVLESGNLEQLIFKHAISTISVPRGSFHHPRPEGHQHSSAAPSSAPAPGTGSGGGTSTASSGS